LQVACDSTAQQLLPNLFAGIFAIFAKSLHLQLQACNKCGWSRVLGSITEQPVNFRLPVTKKNPTKLCKRIVSEMMDTSNIDILWCVLLFAWIVYVWETYLSSRQV